MPCRYSIYNSAKLSDVRRFAAGDNIEVMIINIDAFKKAENIINQAQERLNGETAMGFIRDNRRALAIDGIRYLKLDGEEYYVQEIFDSSELLANLDRNAVKVEHSVYDYVVYDSATVEKPFALALDRDPDVKMFFKIPERFKIETPIGTYNPDWAVYLTRNGVDKLYFILETKGTANLFDLCTLEQLKIHCGRKHFEALDDVEMRPEPVTDWGEWKKRI